jgi:transposase
MDERVRFVSLVNDSDETFTALCERFGISRKTGYKWVTRYEARGAAGLEERRPVAHSFPHQTPEPVLDQLIELRKEHPRWGPKKLRARLEALGVELVPAASTIGDVLKKHGLIRPRRRRVHRIRCTSPVLAA